MEPILLLNKPLGMTPLECIRHYQAEHPEYADVKMGYAGRLDPMAEGLLLVLVGEENLRRQEYLGLNKEYEVGMLLGVATDTYDVLGLMTDSAEYWPPPEKQDIEKALEGFKGDIIQSYPPYSSKTVDGKPLYAWTREGRISEIEIPQATRTISALEYAGEQFIDVSDLLGEIYIKLATVKSGDFRKEAIIKSWDDALTNTEQNPFQIISLKVTCSSGTYMRSLIHEIGQKLSIPALAFSIRRTRVGDFTLPPAG